MYSQVKIMRRVSVGVPRARIGDLGMGVVGCAPRSRSRVARRV
jgi:hypothetical protein